VIEGSSRHFEEHSVIKAAISYTIKYFLNKSLATESPDVGIHEEEKNAVRERRDFIWGEHKTLYHPRHDSPSLIVRGFNNSSPASTGLATPFNPRL
jgi:hypothetical protein